MYTSREIISTFAEKSDNRGGQSSDTSDNFQKPLTDVSQVVCDIAHQI